MNSWFRSMSCRLLMCLLISMLVYVAVPLAAATPDKRLIIRVPKGIDTTRLTVLVGVYGHGLALEPARRSGSREYLAQLPDWTTNVKLLIHHPEYKVIAVTLDPKTAVSKPYVPKFVKATMAPLTIRVIDTNGMPFVDQPIYIKSDLAEMDYLGYGDGMVFGGKIVNGITNSDGEFSTRVPAIIDDPYCRLYGIRSFGIQLTETNVSGKYGHDVLPQPPIPAQRSYTYPVRVTIRYRGQLSGKVERSFLNKHRITGEQPLVYAQRHGDTGASGVQLKSNGWFDIPVSAGTYDLIIEWIEDNKLNTVTALKDVVVGENENRIISIR